MKLNTPLDKIEFRLELDHSSQILFYGSCFAENIGEKMQALKFNVIINPLGIAYNPCSLFNLLERSIREKEYNEEELDFHNERFFSFDLHSDLSNIDSGSMLKEVNLQLNRQKKLLREVDCIFISLGTAWAHFHKKANSIVNNCHKIPSKNFEKRILSIEEILSAWNSFYSAYQEMRKTLPKIVFTVSPVRHLKDGFHENQLSKSTLMLAVDAICKQNQMGHYFPSYEIMMDELRDYRYYDRDLVHPSKLAIDIIWNYFKESCISKKANALTIEIEKILASFNHKPFDLKSQSHQQFLRRLEEEMEAMQRDHQIDLSSELEVVRSQKID